MVVKAYTCMTIIIFEKKIFLQHCQYEARVKLRRNMLFQYTYKKKNNKPAIHKYDQEHNKKT
jgi:hypothetical protein